MKRSIRFGPHDTAAGSEATPYLAEDTEAGLFARLEREMATEDPTVPVIPVPVSPAPQSAPASPQTRQARLSRNDSAEAKILAGIGRKDGGLSAGDISELLAGHYGVSSRTIRRQGWWVPTMAGTVDSDIV